MTRSDVFFAVCTVYELYKIDWMQRISVDRQMNEVKYYFTACLPDKGYQGYSFEQWVEDEGYCGESYVCFEEFMDVELNDKEYIRELIGKCKPLMRLIEEWWKQKGVD